MINDYSEQIVRELKGLKEIPPCQITFFYKLGLVVVAFAMVILPILYMALIAATAYSTWYYAVNYDAPDVSSVMGKIFCYIGPLFCGITMVVFMIKPLFSRSTRSPFSHIVSAEHEPGLFAVIREICRIVGAAPPKEIHIDTDVNASAGFRSGFWSIFMRGDMKLTVGLPLIEGLPLTNFCGIIAHEFGHFTQGNAMRLTYIIRSINYWFARVVYERDKLDVALEEWAGKVDFRLAIILHTARLFVWLSRRVLWSFMFIGNMISSFMLRQMEYDADYYETILAGSESFADTAERLFILNICSQVACDKLETAWRQEKRLADNWGEFILSCRKDIDEEKLQEAICENNMSKTDLFDTHPANGDRIKAAVHLQASGLFTPHVETQIVLNNLDALGKELTSDYYRKECEIKIKDEQLVSVAKINERQKHLEETYEAAERFYQNSLVPTRPLKIDFDPCSLDPMTLEQLTELRNKIEMISPSHSNVLEEARQHDERENDLYTYELLANAGFKLSAKECNLKSFKQGVITQELQSVRSLYQQTSTKLEQYEQYMLDRIKYNISHIFSTEDLKEQQNELQSIWPVLKMAHLTIETLNKLSQDYSSLLVFANQFENQSVTEKASELFNKKLVNLHRRFKELLVSLESTAYPFDHAEGELTLRKYAYNDSFPPQDNVEASINCYSTIMNNLYDLFYRSYSSIARLCEQAEESLGLSPITTPEYVANEE